MRWLSKFAIRTLKGISLYLQVLVYPLWEGVSNPKRFWRNKRGWASYFVAVVAVAFLLWFLAEVYLLTTPYPSQKLAGKGELLTLLLGGYVCCSLVAFKQEWRHYRSFGRI